MAKLKVATVVGTRPEIIRMSRMIPLFDEVFEHTLIHTGQNYSPTLNDVFFRELSLRKPDFHLDVNTESIGTVIGETISKSERVFRDVRPDAVVILGDTNSAFAALMAKRLQIPIYHLEAGNRSFDMNVPEEINRRVVDHLSDFNLPYNSYSYANLIREGIHPRYLCKTGSPLREVANFYLKNIQESDILAQLSLKKGGYVTASLHRQENVDSPDRLSTVIDALAGVGNHFNVQVLLSLHPRTSKRIESSGIPVPSNITTHEPFGFFDYVHLQQNSLIVLSDSGTVSEESAIFGFNAVSVRDSIERQESLDSGLTLLGGIQRHDLINSVEICLRLATSQREIPEGYNTPNTSEIVAKFIQSTAKKVHDWQGIRALT